MSAKTKSQRATKEGAKAHCPCRPSDYRNFQAAAAILGLKFHDAFAEASREWVQRRCPQVLEAASAIKQGRAA